MALEKQPKRNEPGKGLVPTVSGRAKKSLPGQDRAEGNGGRDHGEGGRRAQEEQQWTYPPGAGSAEDIIDAEIVEDEPADEQGSRRERLRDSARAFFGGSKQKADERAARSKDEQAKVIYDSEDMTEREHLLRLRAEVRQAGEQYMASLRDSKLLVPGFSEEEQQQEFNVMHRVYMQMMMHGCMRPLSRGVNPNAIIQSVGMMMTMRMLSPDFKREMDQYLQPIKDKVKDRIDARTRSVGVQAQEAADQHNRRLDARTAQEEEELQQKLKEDPSLADDPAFQEKMAKHRQKASQREGKTHKRGDYLSKKWQRRLEEMERRERGHREMFTPESAAMTEVALMENAFWKMREGGDIDQIDASYRAMRSRLRGQMEDDGLSREEVVKRARMIIGERMEAEPELRLMFNGVAHGRIRKAAPHMERMAGSDRVREVWTGEFEDNLGHLIKNDGMFTLRRPMTSAEHQAQIGTTMKDSMLRALRSEDPSAYGASVLGYLGGFAHRRDGGTTDGLPPVLVSPLEQSETMQAAMAIDGLSDEEAQMVYSNAFTDAMNAVAQEHPGIDEELKRSFGEDWEATLQGAVDDPRGFYARHWWGPIDFEAGAQGHARPKPFVSDFGYSSRTATDSGEYQPA